MTKVFEPRKSQIQSIIFRYTPDLEFLLLKRNPEKGGFWQPITGGVKLDEEPLQTVPREIQEEIGLSVSANAIQDLNYHFFFDADATTRFREDVFAVEISPQDIITLSPEHTEYQWLNFEQALQTLRWESNKKSFTHCYNFLLTYQSLYAQSPKS